MYNNFFNNKKEELINFLNSKKYFDEIRYGEEKTLANYPEFKNDFDVVLEFIKKNRAEMKDIGEELQKNKIIILAMVKMNGCNLYNIPKKFKDDEEITLEAVKQSSIAIDFISDKFKNDEIFLLKCLKVNSYSFQYLPKDIKNNYKFQKEAIKISPKIIQYIKKQTPELVKIAIDNGLKKENSNLIKISEEEFENYMKENKKKAKNVN